MTNDNLAIWTALERSDPKHVTKITGKPYQGNSPKPHWVIWKLTERFGPVGKGFGWEVLYQAYVPGIPHQDGTEMLHECRIRFWHGDRSNGMESYGATKALYKGRNGWVSDEDAAKKSLTDAITKAASWLGVAADIFMGRWDDSKYVAQLHAEARSAAQRPAEPPHDPETGEVLPPRNGSQEPADEAMPPSVSNFIDQVRERLAMGGYDKPTREQLEHGYAMAVIENIAKRKSSAKAKQWFEIFCDLHSNAIARIKDEGLRSQVRSAIAMKQAMIDGENPDPADYGHPFGAAEPIVLGEVRIA
jgi:hypothetical protein